MLKLNLYSWGVRHSLRQWGRGIREGRGGEGDQTETQLPHEQDEPELNLENCWMGNTEPLELGPYWKKSL